MENEGTIKIQNAFPDWSLLFPHPPWELSFAKEKILFSLGGNLTTTRVAKTKDVRAPIVTQKSKRHILPSPKNLPFAKILHPPFSTLWHVDMYHEHCQLCQIF